MFYAYILKSLKDGTYYKGSTDNLQKRIKQHNSGKVKYTKGHLPYKLHYFEEFETRSEALKREKFFKSIDGYKWLKDNNII
jgi:putative endonuclease